MHDAAVAVIGQQRHDGCHVEMVLYHSLESPVSRIQLNIKRWCRGIQCICVPVINR